MSVKIFYCYANEDKRLRAELEKHLGILKRQELITSWSDRDISAGTEWEHKIDSNLNTANIILLLISPDFVHSDYCYGVEMKRALERHENGTARVIPIIIRHGDYEGAAFNHLQALPTDAVPVTDRKWHKRDEAFLDVAKGIRKAVKEQHWEQCFYEGNVYFHRQQYKEALTAFEEAICYDPTNALAYIGKGQTLNQLASEDQLVYYRKAVTAFDCAINLDPLNSFAYEGKAKALYELLIIEDKWADVLSTYETAIHLDPKNEAAYIGQGNAFIGYYRYQEGLAAYEKALEVALFPNWHAYKGKADALYKLERYKEALEVYEQLIQEFPHTNFSYDEIYESKGNALYKLDSSEEALEAYEQAISFGCKSAFIHNVLGSIFSELEVYKRALDEFEEAIRLNPDLSSAYSGKAKVLKILADEAFKKAEEKDPFVNLDDIDPLEVNHPF